MATAVSKRVSALEGEASAARVRVGELERELVELKRSLGEVQHVEVLSASRKAGEDERRRELTRRTQRSPQQVHTTARDLEKAREAAELEQYEREKHIWSMALQKDYTCVPLASPVRFLKDRTAQRNGLNYSSSQFISNQDQLSPLLYQREVIFDHVKIHRDFFFSFITGSRLPNFKAYSLTCSHFIAIGTLNRTNCQSLVLKKVRW